MATNFLPGKYELTASDGSVKTMDLNQSVNTIPLTGNWNIYFDTAWGGPAQTTTDQLKSWTDFSDPGIKYYSCYL